jgi:hypothetical protein
MSSDEYEASVDLEDEHAQRAVVDDFDDLTLRVTGTGLEDDDIDADGIDINLDTLEPRDDAVVELIDGDEVLTRLIQARAKSRSP